MTNQQANEWYQQLFGVDADWVSTWNGDWKITQAEVPTADGVVALTLMPTKAAPEPSAAISNVTVSGTAGSTLSSSVDATITLTEAAFKRDGNNVEPGLDITAWFNAPAGVKITVKSVEVSDVSLVATFVANGTLAAKQEAMTFTIPDTFIYSGKAITAAENANAKWNIKAEPTAKISNVTVSGETNKAITEQTATITLENDTFKNTTFADCKEWFTNLPTGMTASAIVSNGNEATVTFGGIPTAVSEAAMAITIPAGMLSGGNAITVTTNANAKWDIKATPVGPIDFTLDFTSTEPQLWAGNVVPATTNCYDSDMCWSWDYSSKVLILNNLSFTTTAPIAIKVPAGTMITLVGTNSVTSTYSGDSDTCGIYAPEGNEPNNFVHFQGMGSLTVQAGTGTSTSISAGIHTANRISINWPAIVAKGGESTNMSCGVLTTGRLELYKGSLSAVGGAANNSTGLAAEKLIVVDGGELTATGASVGIAPVGGLKITRGKVTASATTGYAISTTNFDAQFTANNATITGANEDTFDNKQFTQSGDGPVVITVAALKARLTVNLNGGSGTTTGGEYEMDELVSINAGTKPNYTFSGWTSSNGGSFVNAKSSSTLFGMPNRDTTITANWTYNGDSTERKIVEVKEVQSFARFGSKVQGFKDGWDGVKKSINAMKPGDSKEIVMSSHVKLVPRSVVETIKGKDITITFISGSDKWKVNGKDIKAAKSFHIDRMS